MNFLISLGSPNSQQITIVNTSSWLSCLDYCEGTGLPIISIQNISNVIIKYNQSGSTDCYMVSAKNPEGVSINHYVWENNFDDLLTWVNLQGFISVQTIQLSNKSYVTI